MSSNGGKVFRVIIGHSKLTHPKCGEHVSGALNRPPYSRFLFLITHCSGTSVLIAFALQNIQRSTILY